jgi:phosphoglycerate dehydrogenase-like enzyme
MTVPGTGPDGSGELRVLIPFEDGLTLLGELPEMVSVSVWDAHGDPPASDTPVAMWVPPFEVGDFPGAFARLPEVRLVQMLTAGYDHILAHRPAGVVVCNAQGIHDGPVAEWVVAAMLASLRRLPEHLRAQAAGAPRRLRGNTLIGKTVTILGYGGIGQAVERRLSAFEAHVICVARRARDGVHGSEELERLITSTDVLVIVAALTDETRGMVSAKLLSRLPDGALVVNASRGAVVDQDAVFAEVHSGRLLAALDVSTPDPLPDGHPLLIEPGVLYTPHVSGDTQIGFPRIFGLVGDQVRRVAAGEPPLNIVAEG